jgi:ubiquinone/menaquinone biosynthesis C-methylase UbiE
MDLKRIYSLGERFRDAAYISSIIQSLELPKDAKILDIGTGWGVMAVILAAHGFSVITGEPNEWAGDQWKSFANQVGVIDRIAYQQMDAQNLQFQDYSVDAVFLLGSLHHVPDKMKAFKEFLRVLNPIGKIVLFDYTNKRIEQIRQYVPHHPPAVEPHKILDTLPVQYEESVDENGEVFCFIVTKN